MRQFSGQSGSNERPQSFDPAQDFPEQPSRHRHVGQLERDVAGVANDPGADLDQFLPQRRQGPAPNALRQGKPTDIRDGVSHTILFGERSHDDRNYKTFNAAGWGEPLEEWGWWGVSTSRKMIGHVTMSAVAPINYRLGFTYAQRSGQPPPPIHRANHFARRLFESQRPIRHWIHERPDALCEVLA
jgi:hypothetical protein